MEQNIIHCLVGSGQVDQNLVTSLYVRYTFSVIKKVE